MRLFRSRGFSAGNAAIFFTFASLFVGVFFFAQLLQTGLGYSPLGAGVRLLPWTATFLTVAPVAGALADRIGERPLMVAGLVLEAAGLAWVALIAGPDLSYRSLLVPFVVAGVGVSMAIPAAQSVGARFGLAGRDRQGRGRQQHAPRARRGVRDRRGGRGLRRQRQLRVGAGVQRRLRAGGRSRRRTRARRRALRAGAAGPPPGGHRGCDRQVPPAGGWWGGVLPNGTP